MKGGLVGNYVVIEGEKYGFLGKILELSLPEKERLELSEKSFNTKEFHPTGKIEILLSFELFNPSKIDKGLNSLPMIGAKVFICSSEFLKGYFKNFGVKEDYEGSMSSPEVVASSKRFRGDFKETLKGYQGYEFTPHENQAADNADVKSTVHNDFNVGFAKSDPGVGL